MRQIGVIAAPIVAGVLLAYSIATTYLVVPLVLAICVFLWAERPPNRDILLFALAFLSTLSILPIFNLMTFGSPLATGYSAGGFYENYPAPVNLANAWEKAGFYLWDSDYGVLWLFPIFFLGGIGLIAGRSLPDREKDAHDFDAGTFLIHHFDGAPWLCGLGNGAVLHTFVSHSRIWIGIAMQYWRLEGTLPTCAGVCDIFLQCCFCGRGSWLRCARRDGAQCTDAQTASDARSLPIVPGAVLAHNDGWGFRRASVADLLCHRGITVPRASRQSRRALNRGSKVSPPTRSRRLREKE